MEHKTTTKPVETPTLPTAEQQLFVGSILSLTWQLFIVVLVPFLGGHYLDVHYNTAPLYTLVGLALALLLTGLITYRAYQLMKSKTGDIS